MEDLFGEAAEKKEVEEIATAMKEARATKSYSSFQLIASVTSFVPNINMLIPPIHAALIAAPGGHDSLKNVSVARELLRHAALGLAANPGVELQPLCIYVRGLLITHLPPLKAAKSGAGATGAAAGGGSTVAAPVALVGSVRQPATEPGVTSGSGRNPLAHELLAFGVSLLLSALRRSCFSPADPHHLALLEPLLPLLQRAMRADSDAVVSLSLRTVGALMSYPMPSLPEHSTALLERTLAILKRAASAKGSELVSIGVKVVIALLRKPPAVRGGGAGKAPDRRKRKGADAGLEGGEGGGNRDGDGAVDGDDGSDEGADGAESAAERGLEVGGGDGMDEDEGEDDEEEDEDDDGDGYGGGSVAAKLRRKVGGGARLNESQLRWLITFVSVHLDDALLQSSLFGLLRVIFGRQFVLPEIYDLVLVLGDMVMQADASAVRHAAGQLFVTFLLTYPLGPKRLQQHFNFMVTNLNYPVAVGRLSLLSLLTTVIDRLPLPVLHRQAELLLIPLVTRLINDSDQECRQQVGKAITRLLARTCALWGDDAECAAARDRLYKLLRTWHGDDALPALQRAAAHLAGLTVDALGATSASVPTQILPLIVLSCQREADAPSAGIAEESTADGGGANDQAELAARWQCAYFSLRSLERLAAADDKVLLCEACEPLWLPLQRLLLHEHAWVRSASGRILGALLAGIKAETLVDAAAAAAVADASGAGAGGDGGDGGGGGGDGDPQKGKRRKQRASSGAGRSCLAPAYLCRHGAVLELTDVLVQQLHSAVISNAAAAQALKNLIWASMAVLHQPELAPLSCRALLPGAAAALEAGGGHAGSSRPYWALETVAARLAPLTQTPGHVRGCTAMRWYAATASQLSGEQLKSLLPVLMSPVARAAEDQSGKVHERVKEMATEALQLLQKRAEAPAFVAAYQRVKEDQKAARRERKRRAALEAVAEPEIAAQKRIAVNQGKRKAKKRKLDRQKRERDSGGSVGLGSKKSRRAKVDA